MGVSVTLITNTKVLRTRCWFLYIIRIMLGNNALSLRVLEYKIVAHIKWDAHRYPDMAKVYAQLRKARYARFMYWGSEFIWSEVLELLGQKCKQMQEWLMPQMLKLLINNGKNCYHINAILANTRNVKIVQAANAT